MTAPTTCQTTCKRRFPTDTAARRALREIRKGPRASQPGHERRAYHCGFCSGWHLSSQLDQRAPERRRQAAEARTADNARHKARKANRQDRRHAQGRVMADCIQARNEQPRPRPRATARSAATAWPPSPAPPGWRWPTSRPAGAGPPSRDPGRAR